MIKNKLDFKLINLAIIAFIVFLVYTTSDFWLWLLVKAVDILTPFILAFASAYALFPFLKFMERKGIPKVVGVSIISILVLGTITILVSLVIPLLFEQTSALFSAITQFVNDISHQYDLRLGTFQTTLKDTFANIMTNFGRYVSNGALNILSKSLSLLSMVVIILFVGLYFLIDMDKIKKRIKLYLKSTNKKTYDYIKTIDHEISQYFNGLWKVIIIQFFEYTLVFFLIGHPNYLLLGVLASLTTIIPYVGGLLTNIIALITASVISTQLFILTLITTFLLPAIDGYIISPKIFGETNKIHPLITIFAVFAGGILYGVMGIIISLPTAIILLATFKYYKKDIYDKIGK
jgi:predicted PurR-regulated permease PerM